MTALHWRKRGWLALALALAACAGWALDATGAWAAPGAGWEVFSNTRPTNLSPGGKGLIIIELFNVGAGEPSGELNVTDVLPPGLTATNAGQTDLFHSEGVTQEFGYGGIYTPYSGREPWSCGVGRVVTCTAEAGSNSFQVTKDGAGAGFPIRMEIAVNVAPEPGASGTFENQVTVTGGGAATPSVRSYPVTISSTPAGFGFSNVNMWFSNEDGSLDTQAGSHPYAATFAFNLNTAPRNAEECLHEKVAACEISGAAGGEVNSIVASLPPGLVGNPHAVPYCLRSQLAVGKCPLATQVGYILVFIALPAYLTFPVYNMLPPTGEPAEFGFSFLGVPTFIDSSVRSGSDYAIATRVDPVPQRGVQNSLLTLWGYPADPSHDPWRVASLSGCIETPERTCPSVAGVEPRPLLTLPTACGAPPVFAISADTWENPALTASLSSPLLADSGTPTGITGCEKLSFDPRITLAPDTSYADTPAGLTVEVTPPVGGLQELEGLSTSDLQDTKVVLPEGIAINPGQAAGLTACSPEQDGLTTEAERAEGREDNGPADCPASSKVGTVTIDTPLLSAPLEGNVYVLDSNPPELKLLVAATAEGVNIKLVGTVSLNERTGQLTSTFEGTPELPFTNFKLSFSGGAQAALATPTTCGTYASNVDYTPWSSPFIGDYLQESAFAITAGSGGAACPATPLRYAPNMTAGATTDQAGGFTDFSLLLQVPDDNQRTERLQFKTPEGLLGEISKVPLCTNAQAEANACPAASQIGHTTVQSGPGPYPLVVPQPGQPPAPIYLTEGYDGGNYGLSIVVPLHVGPFVLPTQRVRARIEVDPLTAQLSITTDPLPQYVAGVPTDLRTIDAVIDKPGFMFNPTNCEPKAFSGTAYGSEGAQAPIASHFQMGSCRALLFQPDFKVSTSGRTSRAGGASLAVKIVYPAGALGANQASSQSNIKTVKVELPRRLPSRLSTLQKACTASQFNANPAGCPAASVVGHVKVITPVLPVPLEGPAYFVSNGGEAFPNLIMVLQGYGVTIHVVGDTFISKAGITSSTFKAVPDVPIQSFELNLPEGQFSALAALGNLCKGEKLVMPTEFIGQDGAEIHQSTDLEVRGCHGVKGAKHKKRPRKDRARHAHRKRRGKR
ncbi:MAG TPA: hypothetical protein VNV42_04780 [Solirubrobacteraceae bacterium]|jgi:hypothetical protein|nr:hypothetical protein [Solirubrobacteraceae bacterium]